MTKEELKKLDDDLAKEEENIRKELSQIAVKNPSVKGDFETKKPEYGSDEDDNAHEVTDWDRNMSIERELETRLREITKTRERIKTGQYGKCEKCSQDIHEDRLKVLPVASLCMSCAKGDK